MATHSRILAWKIPWTEEPMGLQRVRYDWATKHVYAHTHTHTHTHFTDKLYLHCLSIIIIIIIIIIILVLSVFKKTESKEQLLHF